MKRFEIVVRGEHEAEIGHEILAGIYGAVQNFGYADVSVQAETVEEKTIEEKTGREFQIPDFLKQRQKSTAECGRAAGR